MDGGEYSSPIQEDETDWGKYVPTWWMFGDARVDNIYPDDIPLFKEIEKNFNIKVGFIDDQGKTVFEGRYEFGAYGKDYQHQDGIEWPSDRKGKVRGFFDFLCGLPFGSVELAGVLGSVSGNASKIAVQEEPGVVPPFPKDLFEGMETGKDLFELMWLDTDATDGFADTISGSPEPEGPHWWMRRKFFGEDVYPYPGEFIGSLIRIIPYLPWGDQITNPYIYSGNYAETVFYTSGKVIEVLEPVEGRDYPIYKVQFRGMSEDEGISARPSDFAEYAVGDRVTVLKKVWPEAPDTMTWEDLTDWDDENWFIVPVSFYVQQIDG